MYICPTDTPPDFGGKIYLQISFRTRATNYMALLQKMTYKDDFGGNKYLLFHSPVKFAWNLNCRSLFAKEPPIIWLFCGK